MTLIRTTIALALLGSALAVAPGCKKGPSVATIDETEAQNPVALFNKGIEYLKTPDAAGEPNYGEAYSMFVQSAGISPNAKTHFNAAWAAERAGDTANAEKHYAKAYELDPTYKNAMYSLARVLNENGKADAAVDLYKGYAAAHPEDKEVRNDLIAALTAAKQYEAAEEEAQAILRNDPQNAAVYRALSTMYFEQGKLGMSQLCNEKALAISESDPGTYNNMGVTYVLQKDPERAIERFKTAVKLDPNNFEANMNLGFIALNSGDYGLALKSFDAATAADGSNVDAKLGRAVALRGTGDFENADRLYKEIIKADPKNGKAYFNASTLHEKYTKNFKLAQKYLDDFIASHVGEIGPEHEVYSRKERIAKSIEEERQRKEEMERLERERKEREERNKKLLAELTTQVADIKSRAPQCSDPMVQEMAMMTLEQVEPVIEAGDASMAGDLKTFLDDISGQLDACTGGGTPEEGGEPAPEEPAPEAPQ